MAASLVSDTLSLHLHGAASLDVVAQGNLLHVEFGGFRLSNDLPVSKANQIVPVVKACITKWECRRGSSTIYTRCSRKKWARDLLGICSDGMRVVRVKSHDHEAKHKEVDLARVGAMCNHVSNHVEHAIDRVEVLLRKKIVGTIWGSDKVQKYMDDITKGLPSIKETFMLLDAEIYKVGTSLRLIAIRPNGDRSAYNFYNSHIKPLMESSADKLIKIISFLYPAYDLDNIVMENTGSPAHWFYPSNVLEDLSESYNEMLNYLSILHRVEYTVGLKFGTGSK